MIFVFLVSLLVTILVALLAAGILTSLRGARGAHDQQKQQRRSAWGGVRATNPKPWVTPMVTSFNPRGRRPLTMTNGTCSRTFSSIEDAKIFRQMREKAGDFSWYTAR